MSNKPIEFTQEEVDKAALQEQNETLQAQLEHLSRRVVALRAMVNRLQPSDEETDETTQEESDD